MTFQLVIPMSGFGERFRKHGYQVPKPLIRVAGAPMIQHVSDMYPDDAEVLFIVNEDHLANPVFNLQEVLKNVRPHATIAPIPPHKLGPSGAIALARDHINQALPTIVNYCDFTCLWDFEGFRDVLSLCDGVVATYTGFHPHMMRSTKFAYVHGPGDCVEAIQEKKAFTAQPMTERTSSGTYGFSSGSLLLDAIDRQMASELSLGGEYYTSLTYIPLLRDGRDIRSFNIDRFFQWGTPEDLSDFENAFEAFERIPMVAPRPSNRHSTVLLAAGMGARFSDVGYDKAKASLPLSGRPAWLQVLKCLDDGEELVTVYRDGTVQPETSGQVGTFVRVESLTQGQAASAQVGLEKLVDQTRPVTIASCDALFPSGHPMQSLHQGAEIVVWACKPSAKADLSPEQFAWVKVDSDGRVVDFVMKDIPSTDGEWFVVSGTFTFASAEVATSYISQIMTDEITTNGEYYLDSAINLALMRDAVVIADLRDDFIGMGTPEEYETFRYWQGTFHNWKYSSYDLERDWMVSLDAVPALVAQSSGHIESPLLGKRY